MRKYLSIGKNLLFVFLYRIVGRKAEYSFEARKFCIDLKLIFKPFCGISKTKRDNELIVTLTSYGKRVSTTVHYTIFTLLTQSIKPDKVILWLDKDNWNTNNLPFFIRCCIRKGLEVRFCEDLKSYKKLVPALEQFPESLLVTADDDLFYDNDWLENLYKAYLKEPEYIHCHRVHQITFENDGQISPYKQWIFGDKISINDASHLLFPTTGAGVLYPPNSLYKDAIDSNLFKKLAPNADDIWFWAMSVLQGSEKKRILDWMSTLKHVDYSLMPDNPETLGYMNICNGQNDIQMKNVVDYYSLLELLNK